MMLIAPSELTIATMVVLLKQISSPGLGPFVGVLAGGGGQVVSAIVSEFWQSDVEEMIALVAVGRNVDVGKVLRVRAMTRKMLTVTLRGAAKGTVTMEIEVFPP